MIIRIIGLVVILILLYRMYMVIEKRILRKQIEKKNDDGKSKMVRCHECDLFVPLNEAIEQKGFFYCSSSCLNTDKKDKS